MEKIGLIAGSRRFPLIFCQAAKKRKYQIVAVAIKGDTCRRLKNYADKVYWLGLADYSRLFEIFKREGITKITMAGQISPHRLFSKDIDKDPALKNLLEGIQNKKADTIFGAVAGMLEDAGFELMDSAAFIEDLLPQKGVLTRRQPSFGEWEDIYFGVDLAKEIAFLDIGQTVAVKDKAVIAVEALEGTDNLIRRSGQIAGGGQAIVKVSKPNQDRRFDIPVVGLNTVKNLVKAKAKLLAIEAGKTLFIDKEPSLKLANQRGICIVAL